ncbi:unnamed protein product [Sphagnum jensenii]|uniref:Nodulin-like domain-containing protein n=1 Tax=Sphagnum jensenii TaxID=128206 RepID=A0ABP1ASW1_9BRYO
MANLRLEAAVTATKWVGLAAAMWVQASGGNAYMFAFYSSKLKSVLHYNQVQVNNLGVAKDLGENVGLLAGYLCNKIPPWALLSIGAAAGFLGYGVTWLVVSERIGALPYWQMIALLWLGGSSATYFNTAVLVTCMRNFPNSRGTVVGILKGFVGLSAAIFTQIFTALLASDANALLLFLAIGPTVICLAAMLFIRPVPSGAQVVDPEESSNFRYITGVCIALAFYLLAATCLQYSFLLPPLIPKLLTAIMVIFLITPLLVPIKAVMNECCGAASFEPAQDLDVDNEPLIAASDDNEEDEQQISTPEPRFEKQGYVSDIETWKGSPTAAQKVLREQQDGQGATGNNQDRDDAEILLAEGEGAVRRKRPHRGEDFKLKQAIVKADFWLLFFTFFCGVGTGVTALNNLGQIGEAQGYAKVDIFVSLISIANFLGRLGGGSLSEHYIRTSALPRTVWLGVAQVLMIFAHLLFAFAWPGSLYMGSILLGLCYGVHFSIMVPTASELFGLRHFGMIYNVLNMGNPLGSLLFSGLIAGYLYDQEASKGSPGNGWRILGSSSWFNAAKGVGSDAIYDDVPTCVGAHCFRLTFIIMAGVCAIGVVLTSVLTYRIRSVYLSLYGESPSSSSDLRSLDTN